MILPLPPRDRDEGLVTCWKGFTQARLRQLIHHNRSNQALHEKRARFPEPVFLQCTVADD
jgi:hypothetical protein